ncbi:MAG: Rossmann-like and DUF2520 domain-containing protein [Pyrinomonadaceae bacterium]
MARKQKIDAEQKNAGAGRKAGIVNHPRAPRMVKPPRVPVAASPFATATTTAPAQRLTVAIIGAGRLGSAFAVALGASGYRIVALVSRRAAHARASARALDSPPLALAATQLNLIPDADLVLFTTPDDQLTEAATQFARSLAARRAHRRRARRPAAVALHASGALASDALAPLSEHSFALGSLHPLVSISDATGGAKNLRGAFYCLEGEAKARRAARRIVRALGGHSFSIDTGHKALYHAAAVITSGHTVALFDLALALLARCGLTPARARQALLPLLASTLDNLKAGPPEQALTGTFARADLSTVRKHLTALRNAQLPDALIIYALLGQRSLQLAARRNKFDATALDEITRLLQQSPGTPRASTKR